MSKTSHQTTKANAVENESSADWTIKKSGYFRHGGPYDRGYADHWYDRPRSPHCFEGATYQSAKISMKDMTKEQKDAYYAGYSDAAADNARKHNR